MKVSVMTFNLRTIAPKDPYAWEQRKHWAAEIIERYSPDLVGTQEAKPVMLEWLTERFRQTYDIYGVNRSLSKEAGETCAIFVKREAFAVRGKRSFMLSETPDAIGSFGWDAACERICSRVELADKTSGKPVLRFYNTHLDHRGELARKEGLKLVLQNIREEQSADRERLPAIVTGDFNATPDSGLFEVMNGFEPMTGCYDRWTEEEMRNCKTFHNYAGGEEGSPIDYIFAGAGLEFVSTSVIRDQTHGGYPSDHYPVLSVLKWGSVH